MEEEVMRKPYMTPTMRTQELKLGVYGNYGDDGGGDDGHHPIKYVERFQLRME